MSGDMAKLHSIINGWPTVEQECEKNAILQLLAHKSTLEHGTECADPYGVEAEDEEVGEAECDQLVEDGDLRALPSFVPFPTLRPTSAKLGTLTPSTSVGESLASLGSFSPCSSVGEGLHELETHGCNSSTSSRVTESSTSSRRTTVFAVAGKFVITPV